MTAGLAWPGFLLSERQSALYRLQRVLGVKSNGQDQHTLRLRPQLDPVRRVPFVFEKDVLLVAVDIQIWSPNDAPSYIEVGLSALDTRDLAGAVPGYDAANFASHIKSTTYIAHNTAISFRRDIEADSTLAGWTLGCLRKEVAHWLHRTCHRIDVSEIVTSHDDFPANIVLVAHDKQEQLRKLSLFGCHLEQHYAILDILEVRDLHQAFRERTSWTRSRDAHAEPYAPMDLEELRSNLRINAPQDHRLAHLSPSASRAHVVLQAALKCAVNDAEKNMLPLPAVVCDGGEFLGPFAHVRTDRERLALMLSIRTTKTAQEIKAEVDRCLGVEEVLLPDASVLPSDRNGNDPGGVSGGDIETVDNTTSLSQVSANRSSASSDDLDEFWEAPENPPVSTPAESNVVDALEGTSVSPADTSPGNAVTTLLVEQVRHTLQISRNRPGTEYSPGNDSWYDDFAYHYRLEDDSDWDDDQEVYDEDRYDREYDEDHGEGNGRDSSEVHEAEPQGEEFQIEESPIDAVLDAEEAVATEGARGSVTTVQSVVHTPDARTIPRSRHGITYRPSEPMRLTDEIKQKIHVYHTMTELWHLLLADRSQGIISSINLARLRAVGSDTHVDVLLFLMRLFINTVWIRVFEKASSRERSELVDLLELQIHTRLEVMEFYRAANRPISQDHQTYNGMLEALRKTAMNASFAQLISFLPLPSSSQYSRFGGLVPPEVGLAIGQYKQHSRRFAYLLWAAADPRTRSDAGIVFPLGEDGTEEADIQVMSVYADLARTIRASDSPGGHDEMLEHLNGELEGRQRVLEWYQGSPAAHSTARGNAAHERWLHFMIGIKLVLLKRLRRI